MNYSESQFYRNDAAMRFIDTYLQRLPAGYEDAACVAVCEVCRQRLAAGDWQYIGRGGRRHLDYGCSECCAIGSEGELYDTRSGEVVVQAEAFETRVLGEEGVA